VDALIFRASFTGAAEGLRRSLEVMRDAAKQATVGRCKLMVSNPVFKAPVVLAIQVQKEDINSHK
jgi:hypothetical protein